MENLITFGKYSGLSYEALLDKDINYCKFIDSCPPNAKTKHFKEYLSTNLQTYLIKIQQDQIKKQLEKIA
jgi:hypothetical protein